MLAKKKSAGQFFNPVLLIKPDSKLSNWDYKHYNVYAEMYTRELRNDSALTLLHKKLLKNWEQRWKFTEEKVND